MTVLEFVRVLQRRHERRGGWVKRHLLAAELAVSRAWGSYAAANRAIAAEIDAGRLRALRTNAGELVKPAPRRRRQLSLFGRRSEPL